MTKQTIEVKGLPKGYKITKVKYTATPQLNEHSNFKVEYEKIQSRRIVLEETEDTDGADTFIRIGNKWWREVKETDIPLINEDANVKMGVSQGDGDYPKLELSVKELRNVRSLIKDFENLGWFINPERALLLQKITEFIKDK